MFNFRILTPFERLIRGPVVVKLKVGIIFGHEHLVVDVAVVIQRLDAGHAVLLRPIILLAAHFAVPLAAGFFLVANLAWLLL